MKQKKRQTKKNRRSQTQPIKFRYWMEVFVVLAVLGIIFVNGLYLDGYKSAEISYESGSLILSNNGYTMENNSFQYTGNDESFVQISNVDGDVEQLLVAFGNQAAEDVTVTLNYVDSQGNVLDIISESVWKKDTSTVKFDLEEGDFYSFLLLIPQDFTLSKAYYAGEYHAGSTKMGWMLGILLLAAAVSAAIIYFEWSRKLVVAAEEKVNTWFRDWEKNGEKKIKRILQYVAVMAAVLLIAYCVAQAGVYTFSGKSALLAVLTGAVLAVFIWNYKNLGKKIEIIGMVVILLTGAMFAFTEPANVGVSWDDEIHFINTVQLSHLLDKNVSAADATIVNDYTSVALEKRNYNRVQQKAYVQVLNELEDSHYYVDRGGFAAKNTLIAYIPSAIGLILARGLGMPYEITLAVGRWMNTLLLAVLCYFAMKRLKTGKIVVLLIALIPTNMFMAGNYTYDTWLVAWSILGLSAFFGEWQQPEKKMDKITPWVIGASMFLAVLPKQVYFPLTFITIFLPLSKFQSKKECWQYRCIVLAAALLPFAAVYINNIVKGMGAGDTRGGEAVNADSQMDFVRNDPLQTGRILLNFLKNYLNPLSQGPEYITKMAYFGYSPMNVNFLLGTILVGACVSREEGETKFPWWTKIGCLVVYAAIGFIAAFSMYVAFTAVASEEVAGCQGRYLLPALFPLVYVCSRFSSKTWVKNVLKENNMNLLLMLIMIAGSIWGLWTGCVALY